MITEHHTLSRRSALALATVWAGGLTRAWGAPPVVCVVLSDNGPVFMQAANELQAALQAQNPGLAVQRAYPSELDALTTPTLALPLGSAAYRAVTEKTRRSAAWAEVPVIGSLLPRSSHAAVHQALGPRALNTAVLLDQPVARSLRLAQLALPGLSRVGVLYGPQSASLRPATAAAARALGLGLVESQVAAQAAPDDLFAPLSDALEGAELLLALPDSVVYNATSLQNILIASYRRRVPLLGYTAAQVRAGATLGLYTNSAQSAQQVAELAAPWLSDRAEATRPRSGGWSATTEPAFFDVGTNSQVARSLGLSLATPAALPAFLAIAVLLVFFSRTHEQELRSSWQDKGRALAQQLAGAASFPLFANDTAALVRLVQATQEGDLQLTLVQILNESGRVLAQAGQAPAGLDAAPLPVPRTLTVEHVGSLMRVSATVAGADLPDSDLFAQSDSENRAVTPAAQALGHVVMVFNLKSVENQRRTLVWGAVGLTGLVLALAGLLSSWIALGVIRPIHAIADTVRRIGAGEPGARVEADNTGPLRPLAQGVNEMGERIDQAQADLRQKLQQREAELNLTFDRLRAAERQNAVEDERKRLIRDMHDGLGSQLVQTLNLVRGSGQQVDSRHVASMLQHALEELRITLDSLEPISGDLATVMGTLRQRIAPALNAAGIELIWEVQDAPPVAGLDNQGVLHLFRCLQEVFSNVVQHSGANQVRVQIHMEGAAVVLRVADDGRGLSPDTLAKGRPGSRGLGNIRSRAQWMGVPVRFDTNGTGLAVVFEFQPLAPDGAGSVPAAASASASAARVPT